MAGQKVKLKDQLGRVVRVGSDAPGATVGKDLRWPDGTVVKPSDIRNPSADTGSTGGLAATVWKLIREIPANIQKLAKLAGTGFTTRGGDGEWYQRSIAEGEGIAVTNGDGVAGDPTVALAELDNAGGGALQKTARDGYGRLAGTSTATTDDLTEGSANLYFTTGRAAAAAPVQSVNGQTGEVVIPVSVSQGYIEGLRLEWVSATSIRVNSGAAYVPGPASAVELGTAVTKSGLSLAANTWYHVYLFDNAGTADVEISSTDPALPYFGTARAKTGDASRRYLASIRAATGGGIIQFQHDVAASGMSYLGGEYSLRNVLSGGKATAATTVSVASLAPLTSTAVDILATNAATAGTAISGNSEQALPLAAGAGNSYFGYFNPSGGVGVPGHPIDSNRAFQYRFLSTPTGAGLYIDFNGYRFFR